MNEVSAIGLDLAKYVFQAHGADATGKVVFRKQLRRNKLLAFLAEQPASLVAMEACSGAHYWAREIGKHGHEVRLIPPAYVKPFVKQQKNLIAANATLALNAGACCRRARLLIVSPDSRDNHGIEVIQMPANHAA
ncbi:hypothetical protein [Bradyrhizobium sp. SBR1B]|uniref:hypothetical protein n=1 Tax=Bradyrhizobium sp. SBR1B TaxID=2663836 RepID=UPI0017C3B2E0|nr:transposase [Bradyrhizobium sp. SBR1B]